MANGLFSAVDDCWLKLSVKITMTSDEYFATTLPRILRLPTHQLTKIDSGTEVRQQGTSRLLRGAITLGNHMAEDVCGMVDKINHHYRLTTNKWFARFEVSHLRSPSDWDGGLCSNSGLCINLFWIRRADRSLQTRLRWKTDYGAKKTFFRSPDDLTCSRCIGIKRDKDGYLSACLLSKNETQVDVQFGFKLMNHADPVYVKHRGRYVLLHSSRKKWLDSKHAGKENRFWTVFEVERCLIGSLHEFTFIDDCCEVKLYPCTEIASSYSRFLRDDHFLVRLDMRVKHKDNETCEVTVDGKTASCLVSFFCVRCMFSDWSWSLVELEIPERNESVARCNYNHQNWRLGTVRVSQYHGVRLRFFRE